MSDEILKAWREEKELREKYAKINYSKIEFVTLAKMLREDYFPLRFNPSYRRGELDTCMKITRLLIAVGASRGD